jgi:hypothetical protein
MSLKNRGPFLTNMDKQSQGDSFFDQLFGTHGTGIRDPWDISSMGRFIRGDKSSRTLFIKIYRKLLITVNTFF